MKFKTLALSSAFLTLACVSNSFAARIECPQAPENTSSLKSVANYSSMLAADGVQIINDVNPANIEKFMFELSKFPASLNNEMVDRGAKMNIFEGSGVTADPSWRTQDSITMDGRPWSEVPGSGGNTIQGVQKSPTRVVINHLYDNHGSINLVLHERAHALDNLYKYNGVSSSTTWDGLMKASPSINDFLRSICTEGYCDGHQNEGFAELFAYYYACEATKEDLEQKFPDIADFFYNLDSVKDLMASEGVDLDNGSAFRDCANCNSQSARPSVSGPNMDEITEQAQVIAGKVSEKVVEASGVALRNGRRLFNGARERASRIRLPNFRRN